MVSAFENSFEIPKIVLWHQSFVKKHSFAWYQPWDNPGKQNKIKYLEAWSNRGQFKKHNRVGFIIPLLGKREWEAGCFNPPTKESHHETSHNC